MKNIKKFLLGLIVLSVMFVIIGLPGLLYSVNGNENWLYIYAVYAFIIFVICIYLFGSILYNDLFDDYE